MCRSGLPPEEQANLLPKTKAPTPPSDGGLLGEGEWGGEDAGKSPEDAEAAADFAKWQGYQEELMTKFPTPNVEVEVEIPPESDGTGANRRAFYVCNILGQPWVLLPPASPKQINGARQIRWGLTGELDGNIRSFPNFPGKEGHLLKAMLTRASAGSLVSPKGFYRGNSYPSEYEGEDDEDIEEEEESMNRTKFTPISMKIAKVLRSLNYIIIFKQLQEMIKLLPSKSTGHQWIR